MISPDAHTALRSFIVVYLLCSALAAPAEETAEAREKKAFYASLLPANTIAVISASDLLGMIEAARASAFGKLIAADTQLSQAIEVRLRQAKAVATLITSLPEDQRDSLLRGGCALALLPTPVPPNAPAPAPGGRLPFAIFLDVSELDAGALKNLETSLMAAIRFALHGRAVVTLGPTIRTPDGEARGQVYEIKLGEADDQHFAIGFAGDVIVLGFRSDVPGLLNRADAESSLAGNNCYEKIVNELRIGTGLWGYINVDELTRELNRRRPSFDRVDHLKRLGAGDIPGFGFHTAFDAAGVTDTMFVVFRRPRISWMKFLPTTQSQLEGMKFVPKDFDLYISIDVGKGDDIWEAVRAAVGEMAGEVAGPAVVERLDNWAQGIEVPFGINLQDDILGSVGGEIFFAIDLDRLSEAILSDGIDAEKTPYLIGFRAPRQEVLSKALDRVLESEIIWEQLCIEKRRYTFGQTELVKLSSFVEPRIMHGFGFVDGYFLFSPRHTTVEQAVRAYRAGDGLSADPACASLRKRMPARANIEVFARTSVLLRELLNAYSPWLDDSSHPMAAAILRGADDLSSSMALIAIRDDGIFATVTSPVGLAAGLVSTRKLKEASIRRKIALTQEILNKTAAAIDQHYKMHNSFPKRLNVLIPAFLPEEPADPFARYKGMPLRYSPGPRAVKNGKTTYAHGYVLAANGPDQQADFDVKDFSPASWSEKLKTGDAAAIAEMKAVLYQFRKYLYADERDLEDEGDIVLVKPAEPEEGGAK